MIEKKKFFFFRFILHSYRILDKMYLYRDAFILRLKKCCTQKAREEDNNNNKKKKRERERERERRMFTVLTLRYYIIYFDAKI